MADSNQKTKAQHYVPQSYLRRFLNDSGKLWVYDKVDKRTYPSGTLGIAQEKYFYDIDDEALHTEDARLGNEMQLAEKALSQIEGDFNTAVNQLLAEGETIGIRPELKSKLAFSVTIQILRTREARNRNVALFEAMLNAIGGEGAKMMFPDLADDERKVTLAPSHHSLLHLQSLFDQTLWQQLAATLESHTWIFGVNKTKIPFYTSDHPVVQHAHISDPIVSYSGVASKGIEIAFPLSSKYVLSISERTYHHSSIHNDLKPVVLSEDNVVYFNSLQALYSNRFIYCAADNFETARRTCEASPESSNPNRVRVIVNPGRDPNP